MALLIAMTFIKSCGLWGNPLWVDFGVDPYCLRVFVIIVIVVFLLLLLLLLSITGHCRAAFFPIRSGMGQGML